MLKKTACALFGLLAATTHSNFAATVLVTATQDTALHELFDDSNFGSNPFVACGAIRDADPDLDRFPRTRALFRFDLGGKVPANATVTSARVFMSLVFKPGATAPGSNFLLHRMLRPWNEGTKSGTSGQPAGAGEPAWRWVANPNSWQVAGAGGEDVDVNFDVSSSVAMDGVARYTFPSTTTLVRDVQAWVSDPASNFGWMMRSDAEDTSQSARRFGSRESGASAPALEINFTVASTPARIVEFRRTETGMFLSWTAANPPYRVERAPTVLGPWEFVTPSNIANEATAPFGPDTSFYRVVSEVP